jgi:hypothetical protein
VHAAPAVSLSNGMPSAARKRQGGENQCFVAWLMLVQYKDKKGTPELKGKGAEM